MAEATRWKVAPASDEALEPVPKRTTTMTRETQSANHDPTESEGSDAQGLGSHRREESREQASRRLRGFRARLLEHRGSSDVIKGSLQNQRPAEDW